LGVSCIAFGNVTFGAIWRVTARGTPNAYGDPAISAGLIHCSDSYNDLTEYQSTTALSRSDAKLMPLALLDTVEILARHPVAGRQPRIDSVNKVVDARCEGL
jgi:hypothetical protein